MSSLVHIPWEQIMPETGTLKEKLETIVSACIGDLVQRLTAAFTDTLSEAVGGEPGGAQKSAGRRAVATSSARKPGGRRTRSSARAKKITKWVPDVRARRVPNFVIELTGLKTKTEIVGKYGDKAVFEEGKPLPKVVKA